MPRRRRSRTPPRRYSTEPCRPQTAPARTNATSPRSLLDPRRSRPAVTAIAEADVRIPQALAQTQHRRTSGGWFRLQTARHAPPVAEIVLPTTPVAASSSLPPSGGSATAACPRTRRRRASAATPTGARRRAPRGGGPPPPAPAARAAPAPTVPAVPSRAPRPPDAAARAPPANRGVALPGMAGTTNAPPPPLSPATVDRHVARRPRLAAGRRRRAASDLRLDDVMADSSAPPPLARSNSAAHPLAPIAPVAAPPLADGASGRWAMAGAGGVGRPWSPPRRRRSSRRPPPRPPRRRPRRRGPPRSSQRRQRAGARRGVAGTAARDRPWTTYTGALTPGAASAWPARSPMRGAGARGPTVARGHQTRNNQRPAHGGALRAAAIARSAAAPDTRAARSPRRRLKRFGKGARRLGWPGPQARSSPTTRACARGAADGGEAAWSGGAQRPGDDDVNVRGGGPTVGGGRLRRRRCFRSDHFKGRSRK